MRAAAAFVAIVSLAVTCFSSTAFPESVFDAGRIAPPASFESARGPEGAGSPGAFAGGPGFGTEASAGGISAREAAAWSLLLPGLGQQKAGHALSAKIYYGIESAAWISFACFLWMGSDRENTYKDYAVVFGGVQGTDHSKDFYRTIGEHISSDGPDGYNDEVRRDARDLYYPDLAAIESYYRTHAMTGSESWAWRSEREYRRYGDIRDGSRFAYRVALYSALGAAALRIVSAADAVRIVRTQQASASREGSTSIGLEGRPRGVALCVRRSF